MDCRRQGLKDLKSLDFPTASAGLWLDKYFGGPEAKEKQEKHLLVRQVADIAVSREYVQFFERWKTLLEDSKAISHRVKVRGRMAVGLGADSVLETSITLHRTYGVPYIPASALKGLALHYTRKYLERKGGDWTSERTEKLFGTPDEAGYITFFDALYVPGSGHDGRPLHPDVMTVHHPEYYQSGKEPPADWDDPTPIPFLSATGEYIVAVAAPYAEEWRGLILTILEQALREEGIGAKTSSGYGFLRAGEPSKMKTDEERSALAEKLAQSPFKVSKGR